MKDGRKQELLKEVEALVEEGTIILSNEIQKQKDEEKTDVDINPFEFPYETWYTKSARLIEQLAPFRLKDFLELYKLDRRSEVNYSTYTIRDYILGLRIKHGSYLVIDSKIALQAFAMKFRTQISIVNSLRDTLISSLNNIQGVLQADLFDNELDAAEELLKNSHIRPAGVLAGVTLESHLETVCKNHSVKITKRNPTIDTYNTALKAKEIYDVSQWRFIQHLGDLRNKCAHKNTNEPTKEDAQDLIEGVKKIIKTVF